MGKRFGFIGNVTFINNKNMKKQKMNKMVEICMQNNAFRESYEKKVDVPRKVTVPLPEIVDTSKDAEIEMFMEWFSNQRFPEEN